MRTSEIVRNIREGLPARCFEPFPNRLADGAAHFLVYSGIVLLSRNLPVLLLPLASILAGHALGCHAFVAHELSHGSVIRSRRITRLLEPLFWTPNAISASMWRRLHNEVHHSAAGTPRDPDRQPLRSERGMSTQIYSLLFYPNKGSPIRWSPLILGAFLPYIVRNSVAVFLSDPSKLLIVPNTPKYSSRERFQVALELLAIAVFQVGVYWLSGGGLDYLAMGPGALAFSSALIISYVATNHYARPVGVDNDPLERTTSVRVPKFLDWLHGHFSYHTEHHLFPSMNPRFAPLVSCRLQVVSPERYHRLGILQAWRKLWSQPAFPADPLPRRVVESDLSSSLDSVKS